MTFIAKLTTTPTVSLELQLTISEGEARALDAIIGYGSEAFIRVFKEHLGSCYIEPYEKHVISLFNSLQPILSSAIHQADEARKLLARQNFPPNYAKNRVL